MSDTSRPTAGTGAGAVAAADVPDPATARKMLILATLGFAICFWAWALLSPLAVTLREELGLTSLQQSLVVATPVLVGSLGRIPAGALTDRLGAKVMFPAVAVLTIIPVLFLGFFGTNLTALLVGGFFLGIGGTSFAVGVPFVNAWHPPARRGAALGLFGMGTGGTAIAAFTTLQLSNAFGRPAPFILVAVLLAGYAVAAYSLLRTPPARAGGPASANWLAAALRTLATPVALKLAVLYAIAFGGFVAFSVYLPTYLVNNFGMEKGAGALRMAGFVVVSVLARPVGGWLCDRFSKTLVLASLLVGTGLFALLAALVGAGTTVIVGDNTYPVALEPVGTVAFLGMAAGLGAGAGAVFALVAALVDPPRVGAVTGVVGAAGGLGGFIPPLLMGAIYGQFGSYTIGLLLLAVVAVAGGLFTLVGFRKELAAHAQ
ncbi:MFS transporter [Ornithinimicrobium tianjinense]|uniref:MFS transporter n=1 Tax=Ornithinimicrobium tianjinense TaxID=1195761 RepID=A0A917BVM0_9MICO|nr:MFS transporter [Ornithinimicrobium tianjinense]GGF60456.1 MFS transporter [Ornithinimicrobium tianjinense]